MRVFVCVCQCVCQSMCVSVTARARALVCVCMCVCMWCVCVCVCVCQCVFVCARACLLWTKIFHFYLLNKTYYQKDNSFETVLCNWDVMPMTVIIGLFATTTSEYLQVYYGHYSVSSVIEISCQWIRYVDFKPPLCPVDGGDLPLQSSLTAAQFEKWLYNVYKKEMIGITAYRGVVKTR